MDDLEGVEGDSGRQFDVPEPGQVFDRGELGQPGEALTPARSRAGAGTACRPLGYDFTAGQGRRVVALQLVQRFFLRAAPLVGRAQVIDRELGQADAQGRGVGQAPVRVGPQSQAGPRVAAEG